MKTIHFITSVAFCLLVLLAKVAFAQNPTIYPYGGARDKGRRGRAMTKDPLNFNSVANFYQARFDDTADFSGAKFDSIVSFRHAKFPDEANFRNATFDYWADFNSAIFYSVAYFSGAKFDDEASFRNATFDSVADFIGTKFDNSVAYFFGAKFNDVANFYQARFDDKADFSGAKFDSVADFSEATFDSAAYFIDAKFDDLAHFRDARFNGWANFWDARFDSVADFCDARFNGWTNFALARFNGVASFGGAKFDDMADFNSATFDDVPDFVQARFGGTVDFSETDFRQGVDFRQTYFDSVQILYLENIIFPEGKLRFYWQQFQGKDSLRIKLKDPTADSLEHYTRIEILYHQIRDNFLAQDDKASADAVMYELGWQKKEILGQFWWTMYGFFFGYGFQPWRFLVFVVVPLILLFAVLWYTRYYDVLQSVVFKSELENAAALSKQEGGFFQKAWHSLFFSFSVLLAIRFKKSWIVEHKKFLFWASLEWGMGILLFVTFALLAKGARFGFIRDLLGF